jgi:hypothetical protein
MGIRSICRVRSSYPIFHRLTSVGRKVRIISLIHADHEGIARRHAHRKNAWKRKGSWKWNWRFKPVRYPTMSQSVGRPKQPNLGTASSSEKCADVDAMESCLAEPYKGCMKMRTTFHSTMPTCRMSLPVARKKGLEFHLSHLPMSMHCSCRSASRQRISVVVLPRPSWRLAVKGTQTLLFLGILLRNVGLICQWFSGRKVRRTRQKSPPHRMPRL